jgi:DNA topoisomerase-1
VAKPKPLIIVESPAKAKTISRFLGSRYQVKASLGHVRDLPKSQFGVDVDNNFEPRYITIRGKGPLLKELRDAAKKTDKVYLATDPDREGEAISWHLAEMLGLDIANPQRIEFHEITKEAVTAAIHHARPINMELVNAQQARRVLDRVVGYKLSPLLWRKVRPGLSAGRVQSTALRILVDREVEIESFVPEEYYTLGLAAGDGVGEAIVASYAGPLGEKGRVSAEEAALVVSKLSGQAVQVTSVKERDRRRNPAPPFTTSTLQQEAARKLGFTVRRTMSLAQQLYEGLDVGEGQVGLVTYIRTDSTRVAESAEAEAKQYILDTYGEQLLAVPGKRAKKERPGVQDAHEAIRPTSVLRTPERVKARLNRDQNRLYRLIWERFVASQMAPAVYRITSVELEGSGHQFRVSHSTVTFRGYQEVYQESNDQESGDFALDGLPTTLALLQKGQTLTVLEIQSEQHYTEPPARFTEASLVKTLEELGIGRPSTYVPTIETLVTRDYVTREQRRLSATELGRVVVDLLRQYFPEIVDTKFTAAVESQLDEVEDNGLDWRDVLKKFYGPFEKELEVAEADIDRIELPEETTDEVCEICGRPMVVKRGRFGKFLACSGYPECQSTKPLLEKTPGICPKCGLPIVVRRSRKGRTFYGCSGYPQCDFVTWNRPSDAVCPKCGASLGIRRRGGKEGLVCLREGCGHEQEQALG